MAFRVFLGRFRGGKLNEPPFFQAKRRSCCLFFGMTVGLGPLPGGTELSGNSAPPVALVPGNQLVDEGNIITGYLSPSIPEEAGGLSGSVVHG